MKEISEETKQALTGVRKEIIAGKVMFVNTDAERTWNGASDRAIKIIDLYLKGEGLFQQ